MIADVHVPQTWFISLLPSMSKGNSGLHSSILIGWFLRQSMITVPEHFMNLHLIIQSFPFKVGKIWWCEIVLYFYFIISGVYHRYDGVVRDNPNKNRGAWQSLKVFFGMDDYKKLLMKDAELSGKVFQPHWQITSFSADGINGEELINHIHFVVEGLKEVYCRQAVVWYASDFDRIVGAVVSYMNSLLFLGYQFHWFSSYIQTRN